jgi:folate-binding protein YgfZ
VADDVEIRDVTEDYALLHYIGTEPPPAAASAGRIVPARRFGRDGWDLRILRADLAKDPEAFQSGIEIDSALAEVLRIEAGVPRWGYELDENTLPPEAGLDQTHIDYHKGCYIGQEVISRLRSVGHVNRQLSGFTAQGDTPLTAGLRLFASAGDTAPIGLFTSAAYSFALEKPIALGYLKRGSPTGVLLARPEGANGPDAVVTARTLPFVP